METSLWGPFVSALNGEQARQSDRRYWQLSADGTALTEGEGTLMHTPNKSVVVVVNNNIVCILNLFF